MVALSPFSPGPEGEMKGGGPRKVVIFNLVLRFLSCAAGIVGLMIS